MRGRLLQALRREPSAASALSLPLRGPEAGKTQREVSICDVTALYCEQSSKDFMNQLMQFPTDCSTITLRSTADPPPRDAKVF